MSRSRSSSSAPPSRATVVKRRIAAALLLGAVGFAMAGFYVGYGATDLALTQFAIETLATVLFVLVLRFLPPRFSDTRAAILGPVRLLVAIAVGATVFVLALAAVGARDDVPQASVSEEMIERSVPDGKGANVVNVILVDFRGLDTLGEITVLVVAGLGVVALARAARRPGDGGSGRRPTFARLPVVDASARLLYPSILALSLYFLFAGHNQPGGGFVGGLTAGAAISLRYVAGGVAAVRSALRAKPWTVLGTGLAIAATTAIVPLLTGNRRARACRLRARPAPARQAQGHLGAAVRHRCLPRGRRTRPDGVRGLRRRGGVGRRRRPRSPPARGGGDMTVLLAFVAAVCFGCGAWLLMQRRLSRIIIGIGLLGHGANLLLVTAGGPPGEAPIIRDGVTGYSDPLPQALALTAIVITFGVTAFLLALGFRSWQLTRDDRVEDDVEDHLIARRAAEGRESPDDADDGPATDFDPDDRPADEAPAADRGRS